MSQDRYTYLIYKELQQTLTDNERSELQTWLDTSSDHLLQKEQILLGINTLDHNSPSFDVDVEGDYAKVASRLNLDLDNVIAKEPSNTWVKWMLLTLMLLAVALAGYYYLSKQEAVPVLRAMNSVDEIQEIQLADGSLIKLNIGSSLRYPESFDNDTREVELTGEAYFDITRDEARPFIITTSQSKVEVLGTSFNVRESDVEKNTSVAVISGKVRMTSIANGEFVILNQDQKGIVDADQSIRKEDNENLNAMAWESGILRFKSTPVMDVFGDIEAFYDISIRNNSKELDDCTFSMSSQVISLENLLENLNKLFHFDIERKGDNLIIVSGGDCN